MTVKTLFHNVKWALYRPTELEIIVLKRDINMNFAMYIPICFVNTGPMLPQNFNYVKKWKSHCEKM